MYRASHPRVPAMHSHGSESGLTKMVRAAQLRAAASYPIFLRFLPLLGLPIGH